MFWILSYLHTTLINLGLFSAHAKLLLLGLDNAGKTTLLGKITDNHLASHQPTAHPQSRALLIGNTTCHTFDLGGHAQARRLWRDYFPAVSGILFLVDASDRERFGEARAELDALLGLEEIKGVPFVVLGNKIDCPGAVSETELRYELGIFQGTERPVELFMCSVVLGFGYREAFEWLMKRV
jgi:GTP-binding protein SAR1